MYSLMYFSQSVYSQSITPKSVLTNVSMQYNEDKLRKINLKIKINVQDSNKVDGKQTISYADYYSFDGGYCVHFDKIDNYKESYLHGMNSKYSFACLKKSATEWLIQKLELHDQMPNSTEISPLFYSYTIPLDRTYDINEFLSNKDVTLEGVRKVSGSYVISYRYKNSLIPTSMVFSGEITLNIEGNRLLSVSRSSENQFSNQNLTVTYGVDSNGFCTSRSTNIQVKKSGKVVRDSVTDEAFTTSDLLYSNEPLLLSYYGLPEPEGVVWEKPIPSYVWYLSIAGGALAVMFLCGWLLKRRARARAAATTTSAPPKPPTG